MRYALRILFITLALVLLGLALSPKATPADPCDPNGAIPYGWHLRPAAPEAGDSVTVVFTSCRDCVELLGFEMPASGPARLDLRMRIVCPLTLICRPDSLEVPLGRHAAGRYQLSYLVHADVVLADSGLCTVERPDSLQFTVGGPVPPVPLPLPYTTEIRIGPPPLCTACPPRICPGAPIPFHVAGAFPDGCFHFRGLELLPSPLASPRPEPPIVRLDVDDRNCGVCTMDVPPWSADTALAGLPPGTYTLMLQMMVRSACDSAHADTTIYRESRSFTVQDSCFEPPPPGPLPFVTRVQVGPPPPCADCPPRICPAAPISVRVAGTLPSNCYRLLGLELLPTLFAGPRPQPPVLRIVVAQNDCMDWPCDDVTRSWSAQTTLQGLPPGAYELPLELAIVSMCDSAHVDSLFGARRAFTVLDSCVVTPPAEPCVWADWVHPGDRCDDFIQPGGRARVTMTIRSGAPLAGLQGEIRLDPAGLRITGLAPVGRAADMHVTWERTPAGAKFMMFAEQGAPVGLRCDGGARCDEPVLAVSVAPDTDAALPAVTHVSAGNLLGADSLGNEVPQCQIMTLVAVEARICTGASCDFNLDGRLDVRDLVSMVHCVLGTGPCPDTSLARLDCNSDGRLGVDDVLCCARTILHGGQRDTTRGRPEPDVAVQLGEAVWEAGDLRLPVHVSGADRLGAARLALALPVDRYEVTGVELAAAGSQWLELHDVVDGQVVLGLIGLGSPASIATDEPQSLDLTLHLALKPGQSAGGDVGLADLQASGPDGVTLEIATAPPPVPLPAPGALSLSGARPNPFAHETRFALNLDRGTDVDLSVHDLGGRRVATLFHGALGAGPHEFVWRGTRGDGSSAANGIYVLRARIGNDRLTRKVIFLRGN